MRWIVVLFCLVSVNVYSQEIRPEAKIGSSNGSNHDYPRFKDNRAILIIYTRLEEFSYVFTDEKLRISHKGELVAELNKPSVIKEEYGQTFFTDEAFFSINLGFFEYRDSKRYLIYKITVD